MQELFARPYRVVHIAAHGVRDLPVAAAGPAPVGGEPVETVTGVVLGDGMYLTATEIAQMSQAPDVVFVNCCHLGAVGEQPGPRADARSRVHAAPRAGRQDYHQLAASLAAELIDAGVRAVVVCGWAVDDDAATTFATTLYRGLLDGLPFGDAVTAARVDTWEQHPGVNTWGAYQCYADPDFRLRHTGSDVVPAPPRRHRRVSRRWRRRRQHHPGDDRGPHLERGLAALTEYCAGLDGSDWLSDSRVQVRLANAYGEAGELATAWTGSSGPPGVARRG